MTVIPDASRSGASRTHANQQRHGMIA